MTRASYSDVHTTEADLDDEIRPGDMVRTGPNLYPYYTVIAVNDETAWVRNVQTGVDGFTALHRCSKINGAPALDRI